MNERRGPWPLPALVAVMLLLTACGSVPPERPATLVAAERALLAGHEAVDAGEYRAAIDRYRRAATRYRSLDDDAGLVHALIGMAEMWLLLGEPERARDHVTTAREAVAAAGPAGLSSRLIWLEARVHAMRGDADAARGLLRPLLDAPTDDPQLRRGMLITRAQLALDSGEDPAPWLDRIEMPSSDRPDSGIARGRILRLHAGLARREGDTDRAGALLGDARSAYRDAGYRPGLAAIREQRAELARTDRPAAAERHLVRAVTIRLWMHDRAHAARDLEQLIALAERQGADSRAETYRRAAADLAEGNPVDWPPAE